MAFRRWGGAVTASAAIAVVTVSASVASSAMSAFASDMSVAADALVAHVIAILQRLSQEISLSHQKPTGWTPRTPKVMWQQFRLYDRWHGPWRCSPTR